MSDRQLVARFISERDEGAFLEIVRRHGPLVMGVCRRVLGEVHDVEDAFQATFLVFSRDAKKIRRRNSLASWLHGVAYRIAMRAAKKRARHMEQQLDELSGNSQTVLDRIVHRHEERMIDEELNKLPETDRQSLTLRYLEGRSNEDVAAALEISVAAVEGRLKRARKRLRQRLLFRGVSLSTFLGVIAKSQAESQAIESLIPVTIQLNMLNPADDVVSGSYPHELAATEIGEMALGIKSLLTVAAVVVVATGLGFYGLLGNASGQESRTADPLTVSGAANSPAPNTVRMLAATNTPASAITQPDPGSGNSSTATRLHAYKAITIALDQETTLEFTDMPLAEVVDYVAASREIPVIIDKKSLDEVGLGSDTPITVSLSGISLRSCLARMLGELDLDYFIENEMLVITSEQEARLRLDPRVYKLDDLQIPPEKLIELIQSMVAPDTWEEQGGTGRITSLGESTYVLIIAQTDQVHEQIADLLEKLRQAGLTTAPYPGAKGN